MRFPGRIIILLWVAFATGNTAAAEWTPASSGTSAGLGAVAWNGSLFVAVGASGTIVTSPDASAWTPRASGTTSNLFAVAWTGNRFVAAGGGGVLLTSEDGLQWTPRASGTGNDLQAVAGHSGRVVAVGASGRIVTSPSGITWDTVPRKMWGHLSSVAWSGARFVAVGGTGTFTSSTDGVNWSERDSSQSVFSTVTSVCWTGTHFAAVGYSGMVRTSTDGITWTNVPAGSGASGRNFMQVVAVGDQLVGVAFANGTGGNAYSLQTSTDSGAWSPQELPDGKRLILFWAGDKLLAVGADGTILTSTNVVGLAASRGERHRLFPRATASHLFTEIPISLRGPQTRIVLYDLGGKQYRDVPVAGHRVSLEIGGLPRGVYVLEVRNGTARAAQRFTLAR